MTFGPSEADELPGYQKRTLTLAPEDDGPLSATLISPERQPERPRGTVLYLHGWIDYFFQTHLADALRDAGFAFHALDLRRYGRSLHPENRPNYARDITDYFPEVDAALELCAPEGRASLLAHSTGGLIASHFARRGRQRAKVSSLVLNSPFLRFPTSGVLEVKLRAARQLGKLFPKRPLPQKMNPVYGMTIHASQQGTFDYDLAKKPLGGFPFYGGWIDMILSAQEEVERGLDLELPILALHSDRSTTPGKVPQPADFRADCVLRVDDIARLAPRLGRHVTVEAIPGGLHDLTLSAPEVRAVALARIIDFLNRGA